jgi:hypothetical protein
MPKAAAKALTIDLERARSHWYARQGLAEPASGPIEEAIAATGWLRTLGGVDVYIAARARKPGLTRAELDEAKETNKVHVSPAVRGCIYLVPSAHVPLALRLAEEQHRKRIDRDLEKAGTSVREVTERGAAVLAALRARGPLTSDALRKAVPEGAVRNLGEQGKKAGVSSTLPPSLRELEFAGQVERTLQGGRLDTERYLWRAAKKNVFSGVKVPETPQARHVAVAELFFGWVGPATTKDFAEWTGLALRDAKTAVEGASLAPVAIVGYSDEAFALASDLPLLKEPQEPSKAIRLLAFEDNFLVLHGGLRTMTDAKHHSRTLTPWGPSKATTIGEAKHITSRAIVTGAGLVGLWEYDPDAAKVVTVTFDALGAAQKKELAALGEETAAFLKNDIGHAKSFSLDTDDDVRGRAKALKAMR